jgi:formiminotetrahydrofolate cyclodeaminase
MEITQFLNQLASDTPTPGGGSASAFAGALSASLVAMVAGLSLRKGKLSKREVGQIKKKVQHIQKRLYAAIQQDAKSYDAVMKVFRLPKNTERERLYRTKMIQKAFQKATVIPELVAEQSASLLELCNILVSKGNPNAWSDVGVGAYLAKSALDGGLLNIRINLGSIHDKMFKREKLKIVRRLSKKRDLLMRKISRSLQPFEQT